LREVVGGTSRENRKNPVFTFEKLIGVERRFELRGGI